MKNKKLISMTDFVLDEFEKLENVPTQITAIEHINKIKSYAKFLKQPLELGMFVPVDEDGNVLEEPDQNDIKYDIWISNDEVDCNYGLYSDDCLKYQQAKEKVLFKGFEVNSYTNDDGELIEYVNGYFKRINTGKWIADNTLTIERLCNSFSGELTESAIKQLGL